MPTNGTLRERRRAETLAEIKQAAMQELASAGPEGLSMRAVAREVGVSVQALYHYFDSRDALVTALVTDAHDALADAVVAAARASTAAAPRDRSLALGLAYRAWALEHRAQFLLIFGVPLPDYSAPEDGPTTVAARRLAAAFAEVLFEGWTAEELRSVPLPTQGGDSDDRAEFEAVLSRGGAAMDVDVPPGALALFLTGWGQLHGLVMLEVLDHLPWLGRSVVDLHRVALLDHADRMQSYRAPR